MAFDAGAIEATLTLNRNPFTAGLAAAKAQAQNFARQKFEVSITTKLDRASLQKVKDQINRTVGQISVRVSLDRSTLTRVKAQIDRTIGQISVRVSLDRSTLQTVKAQIDRTVGTIKAKVDLDRSSLAALQARLDRLRVSIPVSLNLTAGEITKLKARLAAARFSIPVNVNVQGGGGLGGLASGFDSAAGSASRFERIIAAVIAILPVLASAVVASIGALGGLASAFGTAAAGIGAFALVGVSMFKKINDATNASTTAVKNNASSLNAARNAQQTYIRAKENAAEATVRADRRIEDAERAVDRARTAAADAAVAAERRVKDAERSLQDAQEAARRSQEDLNKARRDAVEDLEDLKLSLRGAALDEEQATLDLEQAQKRYNAALAAGTSGNDLKQLELDVRQAALAVDEAKDRFGDLQQESDQWAKTGVEGSEKVVAAQQGVAEANRNVQDAEQAVADARAEADKTARDSAQAIEDAERNLAEARADAAQQARDNARNIADAYADLQAAQQSQTDSAIGGAVKLTAAEQLAANALRRLKDEYNALATRTGPAVSRAFVAGFDAAGAALKTLDGIIIAAAGSLERAGRAAQQYFQGPQWKEFTDFLAKNTGPTLDKVFSILGYGVQVVMNLIEAFQPLADWMLDGMVQGMKDLADWTGKLKSNPDFAAFLDRVKEALPPIMSLLGHVIEFIFKLAVGLEPFGTIIVRILDSIFAALDKMPPEWLGAIALGIGAIWAAISLGATGPVGLAIGVLAGLAAIFSDLYEKNETFRRSIDGMVETLKTNFMPIWDTIKQNFETKIKPAWDGIVSAVQDHLIPALQRFGDLFMQYVWPKIQPFVDEITGTFIPAVERFVGALIRIVAFLVDIFGPTVAKELGDAITVFQGAFDMIAGLLDVFTGIFTGDWRTFTQGIQEITRGFWTIVAGFFGTNLDGLRAKFHEWDQWLTSTWHGFWDGIWSFVKGIWDTIRNTISGAMSLIQGDVGSAVDKIGKAWRAVANFFRDPINWVIDVVINRGILGGWNTVMGWIGAPGLQAGPIALLPTFARGGAVQGGVPGKDSVPILAQQGEYVLSRPAVNAMGGVGAVDRMHTAARGGSRGGAAFADGGEVGKYATGGAVGGTSFWSLLGGQVSSLFSKLTGSIPGIGGAIGNAINHIPGALVGKVVDALKRKLESIFTSVFGGGGGSVVANGPLQQMIAATAAQFGWNNPVQIGAINWIIQHESGGNPNAQNPTSTAYGLFQFLNSTWASTGIGKTSDPAMQILAGLRYIASRYGSPVGAQAFWQSHGWYDRGGILPPGTTLASNMSGKPEMILTMDQMSALASPRGGGLTAQDVAAIVAAIQQSGGGGGDTYNVMLPQRASVSELADQLDFKRRVVSKGRYSR